jgi:hypothetical protein
VLGFHCAEEAEPGGADRVQAMFACRSPRTFAFLNGELLGVISIDSLFVRAVFAEPDVLQAVAIAIFLLAVGES